MDEHSDSGAVVGLYSITGGLAAVAFTDALQVSIMFFCGIIIVGLGISELGGFSEFSSALTKDNPDHLSVYLVCDHPQSPWPGVILGLGIVLSPAYWTQAKRSTAQRQKSVGRQRIYDVRAFARPLCCC